jgi:hypothetical protein
MRLATRRSRLIALLLALSLAGVGWQLTRATAAGAAALQGPPQPEPIPLPATASHDRALANVPHYTGVGSCAARACHGSPTLTSRGEWNSAYTTWLSKDPHAQAFHVLSTHEAQHMAEALDLGCATKAARCLACHSLSMGGMHPGAGSDVSELLEDGVGCEACHGPAGQYLDKHTELIWRRPGDPKFDLRFGMSDTFHIGPRAAVCAGCHVGQPDAEGHLWRDVNHDLIAAGHPRLEFEFSAYMASLPPHWNVKRDPERFDELHSWIAGQLASADAALKLLECRSGSTAALAAASERTFVPGVWPEPSEYDCFSCHHDLRGNSWRQDYRRGVAAAEPSAALPADHPKPPRGSPGWGTWYFQGPRILAATSAIMANPSGNNWIARLNLLTTSMQTALPDAAGVRQEAEVCRTELAKSASSAEASFTSATPADQAALRSALLKSLDSQFHRQRPRNWDEFVQCYLALVAIERSQAQASHTPAVELLEAIRNRLSFPRVSADSRPAATLSSSLRVMSPGFNSPLDFDPNAKQADAPADDPASKTLIELFDEVFRILTAESSL